MGDVIGFPPGGEVLSFEQEAERKLDAILTEMVGYLRAAQHSPHEVAAWDRELRLAQQERAKLLRLQEVVRDVKVERCRLWNRIGEGQQAVLTHRSGNSAGTVYLAVMRRGYEIRADNFWIVPDVA